MLAAAFTGATMLTPRAASACSLIPTFRVPSVQSSALRFLGHATGDTVPVGTGRVRLGTGDGHLGRPAAYGAIYGQVVRVERLAAEMSPTVSAAVRAASGRVVLVPWDYGADCRPLPWTQSARWLPDTVRGLYQGTLRDRAHWVAGLPTLDVFAPQYMPYTGAARDLSRRPPARTGADSALPALTPDELLDVLSILPTHEAAQANPDAAYAPLRAWAAVHSSLARREPARDLIRAAEYQVSAFRFSRRAVPLPGTYRITIRLAADTPGASDADSATFYVRTEDRPTSPTGLGGSAAGMYVLACTAATEAALPADRIGCRDAAGMREGYLAFGDSTWIDKTARTTRGGSVDIVTGDAAFQARYRQLAMEHMRNPPEGTLWRFLPGRFVQSADGAVSFTRTLDVGGVSRIRITGIRVSNTVLRQLESRP